ncbi:helix-turn-helix domain-containing protein [Pseudomonas citronellolis]|uniref:helix-turn-helix domain-containing protein n=1 Tax=Pseudomonas citronellolis TaxID=53408 RepID=UPI0023E46FE4|nr:helix-turn-helix domain-containing protein [Pseudomonas citronellolis]MDF3935704.1 helix-turn-helix domain-containing protein [Pseudomonas citronellolis]
MEARRERAHSHQSVKAIAHGPGFFDVGYFGRFFRTHTQLTPSEFRQQGAA